MRCERCFSNVVITSKYKTKGYYLFFGKCEGGHGVRIKKKRISLGLLHLAVAIAYVTVLAGIIYWGETTSKEREVFIPDVKQIMKAER